MEDIQTKQAILEEFEKKKKARSVAVPTDDVKVRLMLRQLGEPRVLFAEDNFERRERLRELIAKRGDFEFDLESSDESEEEAEEFFTYGSDALLLARQEIFKYSIPRAKARILLQKQEFNVDLAARKKMRFGWFQYLQSFETKALQFGDERPLSFCSFSPNSKLLAVSSFSGLVKLWSVPGSESLMSLKGHRDRVCGLDFHPQSTLSQSHSALNLVTGALDGTCHLWSLKNEKPMASLQGHVQRVSRSVFHPSGRYIGTCSFDTTWRLWDSETCQELLLQEGHSKPLYGLAFQQDGSLCATGGQDALSRIWDLRTGRSIMVLKGHLKDVLSLDWAPNGYHLATGSEDHTIKVFDIRTASCLYTVPAHNSVVTQVKYFKSDGCFDVKKQVDYTFGEDVMDVCMDEEDPIRRAVLDGSFLVSSSYDGTCKIWTDGDFKPMKSLTGLEGKITSCAVSQNAKFIATTLYDRTFKLFAPTFVDIPIE